MYRLAKITERYYDKSELTVYEIQKREIVCGKSGVEHDIWEPVERELDLHRAFDKLTSLRKMMIVSQTTEILDV